MSIKFKTISSLIFLMILVCGCRKDKTFEIKGVLLFTSSDPRPVTNYQLDLYQRGGNAIIIGTSSSSAITTTDENGAFAFIFTPGKGYLAGIPTTNGASTTLTGDGNAVFPGMSRNVFPDSISTASGNRIFLAMQINRMPIRLQVLQALIPTDTIIVEALTLNGRIQRTYTGLQIAAGNNLVVDTLNNVLATNYRVEQNGFSHPLDVRSKRNYIYLQEFWNSVGKLDKAELESVIVIP